MAGYGDKDKLADEPAATGGYGAKDVPVGEVAGPGFIPTVKRTGGQMLTTAATTIEDVTGPNAVTRGMRDIGEGIITRNPAGINELGDIVESPWLTAKEAVGQFVPQIGAAAAGAVAGGRLGFRVGGAPGAAIGASVGSLVPIATQEYGGIRQEQIEGGQESIPRALTAAAGATALERIGMGKVLKGLRGEMPAMATIPREIAKGAAKEGATEAAQTAIEQVGAFKDPTAPESLAETGLAGVMGGIGGAVIGGAQAGVQRALQPHGPNDQLAPDQPAPNASTTPGADVDFGGSAGEGAGVPPAAAGDPLRATKLPETGMLTAAVNAGIEAEAQAADAGAPVQAPISGALAGIEPPQQGGDASNASTPGGGEQEIPTGEASEADPETMALFDPASATLSTPERANFGSREEVERYLSQQRRAGGSKQGKALPVERGDGRWSFARDGEPEFEAAQQAQQQREADDRMRADVAFQQAQTSLPQHLRDLKPADRKLFGLDKAIEQASKPLPTNEPIGEVAGRTGVAFTPEMAAMQAHNALQAVKTQDGMLRSGNRTGATTGGLVKSWINARQSQRMIEESRKAEPELWAGYDQRQAAVKALNVGDDVRTPYPSPDEPQGTIGKITRKFGTNWRIQYPDGNVVMVPPTALRPVDERAASATVTAQNSQRQESGAQTDPNATGNGNMARNTTDAAPGGGQAEGETAASAVVSPGSPQSESTRQQADTRPPPTGAGAAATSTDDAALDAAAHVAATSHLNDRPAPTGPQLAAGNYQKGHHRLQSIGHDISIETAKGTERVAKDGSWRVPNMPAHYGDINRTTGADGDPVDIFIGDRGDNGRFWVINQMRPGAKGTTPDSSRFDEHKVITGVDSADEATTIYKASFADGFGDKVFGSISAEMSADELKALLPSLKKAKAVPAEAPAQQDAAAPATEPGGTAATEAPAGDRGDAPEAAAPIAARQRAAGIEAPRMATIAERRQLRASGVPAASVADAERALGDGAMVFREHDLDGKPMRVFSHVDLDGYTADQITIVRGVAPAPASKPEEKPEATPPAPPTAAPASAAQYDALTMPAARIEEFAGKIITLDAVVAETGKTVQITMNAAAAIRDIRKRTAAARDLARCLA